MGWDRKFRLVMLISLALIGWIGLKGGLALFHTHARSVRQATQLSELRAQHRSLLRRERSLHQRATITRDARELGMVRAGERPYVIVSRAGS